MQNIGQENPARQKPAGDAGRPEKPEIPAEFKAESIEKLDQAALIRILGEPAPNPPRYSGKRSPASAWRSSARRNRCRRWRRCWATIGFRTTLVTRWSRYRILPPTRRCARRCPS